MSPSLNGEIGFGVIGAGNIALIHGRALAALRGEGVRLRAFLGRQVERTRKLADQFGAEALADAERFFARPDIQVVTICTPSGTHAELGQRAAAAGKHVLVEKPIDVNLAAARSLIAACEAGRVQLGVILQSRFQPAVQLIKKAVGRGRLGRLHVVDGYVKWYRTPEYYAAAPWRGTKALDGGGALINQAIHTVDLVQHFAGRAVWISGLTARKQHPQIEGEDTALALLRYESGAAGVIEATTSLYPGFSRRVELHGERGSIVLDGNDITYWNLTDRDEDEEEGELDRLRAAREKEGSGGGGNGTASDPMALDILGHQRQIEDFVDAVRTGRPPAVDGPEALKALEIVLGVYRSAELGRPVELPDLRAGTEQAIVPASAGAKADAGEGIRDRRASMRKPSVGLPRGGVVLFTALASALACNSKKAPEPPPTAPPAAPAPAKPAEPPAPADVKAPPADAEKTASGIASKVIKPGTGKDKPAPHDLVKVNYTGWTTDGKMFDTSVGRGPAEFPLNEVIKGWTEGLQLMVEGEQRRLWIPAALAYGEVPTRPGAPAGTLVFDVELLGITKRPAPPPPPPVPADVAAAPKNAKKTKSGLAYRVLQKGTGKVKPTASNMVEVHYTGWTKDGKMFDSSVVRGATAEFPLGQVIPGWTEGLQLMVVGEKTRFWIPAALAYGETPTRPGAPSGMLVFDVELVGIK